MSISEVECCTSAVMERESQAMGDMPNRKWDENPFLDYESAVSAVARLVRSVRTHLSALIRLWN